MESALKNRVYNFAAGPAGLPGVVLEQARDELMDWRGTGSSVMEISHRSKEFIAVAEQSEANARDLLAIPDNYRVLFLQGGATSQFAMAPRNLLRGRKKALYVSTGAWSEKAIKEARLVCDVELAASSEAQGFTTIPPRSEWRIDADAAYLHYTSNETIGGVQFHEVPDSRGIPLVSDMSSDILSQPLDISRFGVIYAGAQKNMGPAGITLVIVRDDLLGDTLAGTPSMFDFSRHAEAGSMLNTPPTFNWYLMGLVFSWVQRQGGVENMLRQSIRKSEKLYAAIDRSSYYSNPVDPRVRSRMNVPFILADKALDGGFLSGAVAEGLVGLKGHRLVGGMRASLYNAMPEAGVDALIEFMSEFERTRA